ncbi:MAG: alpha-amylase family glycosyl hydrolase [Bacteroidota bacterium]
MNLIATLNKNFRLLSALPLTALLLLGLGSTPALKAASSMATSSMVNPSMVNPTKDSHLSVSVDSVRIYQIYIRNFSAQGNLQGVIAGLDRIQGLGCNTLWLMPVHPVGVVNRKGTFGSPYAVQNYRLINPEFGTDQDFSQLVRECHRRGMRVILDWVANHTAFDHPWIQQNPQWYTRDTQGRILPPNDDWTDVADLNFDEPALRDAMIQEMEYWVKNFDIDGFRCDVAMMVPAEWWKDCMARLRGHKPLFMLAEASGPEFYTMGFNSTYGWDFYHKLKGAFQGQSLSALDSAWASENAQGQGAAQGHKGRVMRFVTNHDETSWDDVPVKVFGSTEASLAAYVIAQQPVSIPLIYNGQEVGQPIKQNIFEYTPIDYSANPKVNAFYKTCGRIFKQEPAYYGDRFERLQSTDPDCWWSLRGNGQQAILVVVNIRNKTLKSKVPADYRARSYVNLLDQSTAYLKEELELEPYGIRVYKAFKP